MMPFISQFAPGGAGPSSLATPERPGTMCPAGPQGLISRSDADRRARRETAETASRDIAQDMERAVCKIALDLKTLPTRQISAARFLSSRPSLFSANWPGCKGRSEHPAKMRPMATPAPPRRPAAPLSRGTRRGAIGVSSPQSQMWNFQMGLSTYFRHHADACARLAGQCFDLTVAGELRDMAVEFRRKAAEVEREDRGAAIGEGGPPAGSHS